MAALFSLTKVQARSLLAKSYLPRDDYLSAADGAPYIPTAAAATTLTFADLAGVWPDGHWIGADVRAYYGGVGTGPITRRVTGYTGSSGLVTVPTSFGGTPSGTDFAKTEMLRAPYSFAQLDSYLSRALYTAIEKKLWVDRTDTTLMVEGSRSEYPLPSGFAIVQSVEADWTESLQTYTFIDPGINATNLSELGLNTTTAVARRGQGFKVQRQGRVDAVWLQLRKIGSPTGTMTLTIQTDTAGLPSGTNVEAYASTTVTEASIPTDYRWVKFAFTNPPILAYDTQYHISLATSGTASTTNYIAWRSSTNSAGGDGSAESYSSVSGLWSLTASTMMFHRVMDTRADWRRLDFEDVYLPNGSTRTIVIKPDVLPQDPVPVKIIGQGAPATIDGTTNDATTIDINPEWLILQASAMWLMDAAKGNRAILQQAIALQQRADQIANRIRVLTPSLRVERN